MQLMNIVFNGYLIPVTPLTQMPADTRNKKKNKKKNSDDKVKMAYQEFILSEEMANRLYQLKTKRAMSSEDEDQEEENKISRYYKVPIFTANGIRGVLRRKCAYSILNAISKREKIKNYDVVDLLRAGGNRVVKYVLVSTFDEINKYVLEKNPHLGLFGGTLNIPARLYGSDAIPLTIETAEWLAKRKMKAPSTIDESVDLPFLSQIKNIRSWIRRNDWGKEKEEFNWFTEEEIKEIYETIAADKKKIAEEKKNNKTNKQDQKSDIVNLEHVGDYEYIVPGTKLCLRFELENVTDVMLGLFVNGWLNFAKNPYLGALRRFDFGRVMFEFTIQIENGETYTLKMVSPNHAEVLKDDVEVTEEILEPFNEYLEKVKIDDLDVFKHLKWRERGK